MSINRMLWMTTTLLLGLGQAGADLTAEDRAMPENVMMYYGSSDNETKFDARYWFESGQYRPRQDGRYPASLVTMLRTRPMPFTQEQNEALPVIAYVALQEHYPDIDSLKMIRPAPNLGNRVRYAYSKFAEPNQPVDYYYLYVELDGIRYVVTFDRDGQTGVLRKTVYWAEAIIGEYAAQAEYRRIFEEIEAEERRQGLRD